MGVSLGKLQPHGEAVQAVVSCCCVTSQLFSCCHIQRSVLPTLHASFVGTLTARTGPGATQESAFLTLGEGMY